MLAVTALQATTISGRITRSFGGSPVGFAQVELYGANDAYLETAVADGNGVYSFVGLNPGTYFVRTRVAENLIDRWYTVANVVTGVPSDDAATSVNIPNMMVNIALQEGGQVEGIVRDFNSLPVSGITIEVYERLIGTPARLVETTLTQLDGTYVASGLRSAQYYVRTRELNGRNLVDEWYNNRTAFANPVSDIATAFSVTAPGTESNVDFDLAEGGIVEGLVNTAGGAPVTNMSVKLFTPNGDLMDEVFSDTNGLYRIAGLSDGNYHVRTDSSAAGLSYVDEWFDDRPATTFAPLVDGADAIDVQVAQTNQNINLELDPSISISGRITYRDRFGVLHPLENCGIWLSDGQGGSLGAVIGVSDVNDNYEISGLSSGTYYLATSAPLAFNLLDEWYDDKLVSDYDQPEVDQAFALQGVSEPITGVNIELAIGGFLTGQVTDSAGAPLEFVEMRVFSVDSSIADTVQTDAGGIFGFTHLPPHVYYLEVMSIPSTHPNLLPEYYEDQWVWTFDPLADGATAIELGLGESLTNANFSLEEGAELSGFVLNDLSNGVPFVEVEIISDNGGLLRIVNTDTVGRYRFNNLAFGNYYLRTRVGNSPLIDEWFDDVRVVSGEPIADGATPINFSNPAGVTGVNLVLVEGSAITGQVTDASFSPIDNVVVEVYEPSGLFVAGGITDASGVYRIEGLLPGDYGVRTLAPSPYADKWWSDVPAYTFLPNVDLPNAISVMGSGAPAPEASFVLELAGEMVGHVETTTGVPLSNIPVEIYTGNGTHRMTVLSSSNGVWQATWLPPETYYVRSGVYHGYDLFDEWFGDVATTSEGPLVDGALPVVVGASEVANDINLVLASGAQKIYMEEVGGQMRLSWSGLPGYSYVLNASNELGPLPPWPLWGGASAQVAPTNGSMNANLMSISEPRSYFHASINPQYLEDVESGTNGWQVFNSNVDLPMDWAVSVTGGFDGQQCWFGTNLDTESDMSLVSPDIILSGQTELSFWHQYDFEENFDGGVVEISINGDAMTSSDLGPWMTLNAYNAKIIAGSGNALAGRPAFTGSSGGYLRTVIDLTPFVGQTVKIRFRLTSNDGLAKAGWWIDRVMIR